MTTKGLNYRSTTKHSPQLRCESSKLWHAFSPIKRSQLPRCQGKMRKTCLQPTASQNSCWLSTATIRSSNVKRLRVRIIERFYQKIHETQYGIMADCFSQKYGLLCASRHHKEILIYSVILIWMSVVVSFLWLEGMLCYVGSLLEMMLTTKMNSSLAFMEAFSYYS
jgi:hypothetical protein